MMADASALRRYFNLAEDENAISRRHFVGQSKEIGMTSEELEIIFTALDTDGNDIITLDELLGNWNITDSERRGITDENPNYPASAVNDSEIKSSFSFDDSFGAISLHGGSTPTNVGALDDHKNHRGFSPCQLSQNTTESDAENGLLPGYQHTNSADIASPPSGINKRDSTYCTMYRNENTEIQPVSLLKRRQLAAVSISKHSASKRNSECADSEPGSSTPVHNFLVPSLHTEKMDHPHSLSDSSGRYKTSSNGQENIFSSRNISPSHDLNKTYQNSGDITYVDNSDPSSYGTSPKRSSIDLYTNNKSQNQKVPNDQNYKILHVISRPKTTDVDVSGRESQRRNSIRVLKTAENKTTSAEQEILAPVKLDLGSNILKLSDNNDENPTSSSPGETVFEYDSAKIFGKLDDSRAVKKHRKKSPRPESVYARKFAFGKQVYRSEFPVDLELLSKMSQEQVCELYQNLHSSANPELVAQFENILLNVIKDVRQYKMENERLEKTYRKEKDEHDRHLRHMEDEMEQQVQNIEHKVRRQEKERLESEKFDLRVQLDSEITMLQQNLKKLQQEGLNKMDNEQEEHLLSMKKRLEEISMQNRMLKSELTDAQTNLALVKTEMTSVKQQLDEKTYELDVENKTVEVYQGEQEKLMRQLQLLHEANKNLLDTNDNLREMLDTTPTGHSAYKRTTSTDSGASARSTSPLPPRKGSVMSDYVDALSPGNRPLLQPSFQDEVGMIPQFMAMSHRFESCEEDSIAEELDSGHSTLRDGNDLNDDADYDTVNRRRGRRHRRVKSNLRVPVEEEDESHDEMESEGEGVHDNDMFRKSSPNHYRSASVGSRGSGRSQRSLAREESILSNTSRSSRGSTRRQLPAVPKSLNTAPVKITKEPDRVYKIVLAGDAAVGKSSFIVRLCKGKFVSNLSSTLGVDFQTKMLEVDGNTTALQLWDTAGQERFRSVARTYFRRADGVLLLYDVTYERSFLNIREWLEAIEDNSVKKIPIMLVANKVDARLELEQQGRRVVKYEDGLKLSKEIDAHFIESSAKEGSNIHEAVIELTRTLRTNEDIEVQTVGLQLTSSKEKKDSSCCGKS